MLGISKVTREMSLSVSSHKKKLRVWCFQKTSGTRRGARKKKHFCIDVSTKSGKNTRMSLMMTIVSTETAIVSTGMMIVSTRMTIVSTETIIVSWSDITNVLKEHCNTKSFGGFCAHNCACNRMHKTD